MYFLPVVHVQKNNYENNSKYEETQYKILHWKYGLIYRRWIAALNISFATYQICTGTRSYPGMGVTKAPFANFSVTGNFDLAKI